MKDENRPDMAYRVVVVKRQGTGGRTARLRVQVRGGEEMTLHSWEWASGRPTESQLADMVTTLAEEVSRDVISRWGLQGDLLG